VGFVVDKVALGQVFPRVLWFSLVNFIPPVLHYKEKRKKLIIFIVITGLYNKPQGCGTSVASAAGYFTTKKRGYWWLNVSTCRETCFNAFWLTTNPT
jgi:sugar phosphate permease